METNNHFYEIYFIIDKRFKRAETGRVIVNKNRIIKSPEAQEIIKEMVSSKAKLTALIYREKYEL